MSNAASIGDEHFRKRAVYKVGVSSDIPHEKMMSSNSCWPLTVMLPLILKTHLDFPQSATAEEFEIRISFLCFCF